MISGALVSLALRGQPGGASSKPENSKPGATPQPDLRGIDLVSARNLAGVEKKINQRRDGPASCIPRRIAKGLTEIAAL